MGGYLLLAPGLSDAVFVSGVLLLIFVTATGTMMRTSRQRGPMTAGGHPGRFADSSSGP